MNRLAGLCLDSWYLRCTRCELIAPVQSLDFVPRGDGSGRPDWTREAAAACGVCGARSAITYADLQVCDAQIDCVRRGCAWPLAVPGEAALVACLACGLRQPGPAPAGRGPLVLQAARRHDLLVRRGRHQDPVRNA